MANFYSENTLNVLIPNIVNLNAPSNSHQEAAEPAAFPPLDTFLTSGEAATPHQPLLQTPKAEGAPDEPSMVQRTAFDLHVSPTNKSIQPCVSPQSEGGNLGQILKDSGCRSTYSKSKVNMQNEFLSFCSNLEYAKDHKGNLYVTVVHGGDPQVMAIRSSLFHSAARVHLRPTTGKNLSNGDFQSVVDDIEFQANRIKIPLKDTITRAQREGEHLYILMSTAPESYLKFNLATGEAEYVSKTPFLPVHLSIHALPKPIFQGRGAFNDFFALLGVTEMEDRALIVSILVTRLLLPKVEVPHLMILGEPMTGKTTLARLIKNIIDPSAGVTHAPSAPEDLIRNLEQQFLPVFDNISALSRKLLDILCTATTGAGYSGRKKYTNDGEHLVVMKTSCIMTSTRIPKLRDDLSSRIFFIRRPPITGGLHGEQVNHEFAKLHPRLLGELLQICGAIDKKKDSKQAAPKNERMVDFFGILSLVCQYAFNQQDLAAAVIKNNDLSRGVESVGGNPEVAAILLFMKDKPDWKGTITELIKAINAKGVGTPDLSQAANAFSRKLKAGEAILESKGIQVKKLTTGPNGQGYHLINYDYIAPEKSE